MIDNQLLPNAQNAELKGPDRGRAAGDRLQHLDHAKQLQTGRDAIAGVSSERPAIPSAGRFWWNTKNTTPQRQSTAHESSGARSPARRGSRVASAGARRRASARLMRGRNTRSAPPWLRDEIALAEPQDPVASPASSPAPSAVVSTAIAGARPGRRAGRPGTASGQFVGGGAAVDAQRARTRRTGVARHRLDQVARLERQRLERGAHQMGARGAAGEAEQRAARVGPPVRAPRARRTPGTSTTPPVSLTRARRSPRCRRRASGSPRPSRSHWMRRAGDEHAALERVGRLAARRRTRSS